MPSSGKACREMLAGVKNIPVGPIVDLGSGWGTLVFAVARKYKQHEVIGYEKSFFPWCVSMAVKIVLRIDNATFYRRDFLKADLSDAGLLLCYLFPDAMHALEYKLSHEKGRATLLISNTFAMPTWSPIAVTKIDDIYRTPIYIYDIKLQLHKQS